MLYLPGKCEAEYLIAYLPISDLFADLDNPAVHIPARNYRKLHVMYS